MKNWISKGAQPTGSIHNLLITKGVIIGKKVNVLPKKTPIKKETVETTPATVNDNEIKEETPVSEASSAVGETKSAETASAS